MGAAKAYCSENVYSRLAKAGGHQPTFEEVSRIDPSHSVVLNSNLMEMSEFLSAIQGGGVGARGDDPTVNQSIRGRRRHSFDAGSHISFDSSHIHSDDMNIQKPGDKSTMTARQLQNFLHRQRVSESRKAQKIERLIDQTTPSFQPKVNDKSRDMATSRGSFLDRMDSAAIRKERKSLQYEAKKSVGDETCTFKPEVKNGSRSVQR